VRHVDRGPSRLRVQDPDAVRRGDSATDPEHEIDETGARYQSVPSRDAARLWW
jgi:hypothetical protein